MNTFIKKSVLCFVSVSVLVLLWYLSSLRINSSVILPSPKLVFLTLIRIIRSKDFLSILLPTFVRTVKAFVSVVFFGALAGTFAGRSKKFALLFKPVLAVLKVIPAVSIILLAFIWFKTSQVPVFSAFLMAFPVMFIQSAESVDKLNRELLQVCSVFRIRGLKKFYNYTLPSMLPDYITGAKQSLALIWKVVLASEVITVPSAGLGRSMQFAQIHLQTEEVFAWTLIAIITALAGDLLFSLFSSLILKRRFTDAT